jgi:hypothetical protein
MGLEALLPYSRAAGRAAVHVSLQFCYEERRRSHSTALRQRRQRIYFAFERNALHALPKSSAFRSPSAVERPLDHWQALGSEGARPLSAPAISRPPLAWRVGVRAAAPAAAGVSGAAAAGAK